MKNLIYLLTGLILSLGLTSNGWAARSCDYSGEDTDLKSKSCELVEAEDEMVVSAQDLIAEACADKKNSKSCDNASRRLGKLKDDIGDIHSENDALRETDYTEMVGASYKGRGRDRDDVGTKSCQSKNVDSVELDDFLAEMVIEDFESSCTDCQVFFNAKDQDKAYDDKCNSWKIKVIDEGGIKDSTLHISEKQEGLCPIECKGKDTLVDDKRNRFRNNVNTSIDELTLASAEMQNESAHIASSRLAAQSAELQPMAIEEDDCDEMGTDQPISAGVIVAAFTVVNATEWVAEICDPPADQTIAGFNASAVCLIPVTVLQIAKEVHDVLSLFNDEFQGEQISHIQECSELMNTKIDDLEKKIGDLDDQIKVINSTVNEIRVLVVTPQGQRETTEGDSWPNKKE